MTELCGYAQAEIDHDLATTLTTEQEKQINAELEREATDLLIDSGEIRKLLKDDACIDALIELSAITVDLTAPRMANNALVHLGSMARDLILALQSAAWVQAQKNRDRVMKPDNPALHLDFEGPDAHLTSLFIAQFFESCDDDLVGAALEFHDNIRGVVARKAQAEKERLQ
jgi:hypothetical protein